MARSITETLLSLDQWASIMGFDPFQFNQIGEGGGLEFGRDAQCQTVWYQWQWQKQFLSREEIAQAIAKAESAIIQMLSFYPAPQYTVAEEHPYPQDSRLNMPDWLTPKGAWKSIGLNHKKYCSMGTRTRTLVSDNQAYVESDKDGDGVNDTFTITVATTETNPDYLAVYFNNATRDNLDETWRIRPVQVSIASGTATITGHLSQLVDPSNELLPNPVPLQVDGGIYVSSVDIYQVKPDVTDVGTAYWNRRESGRSSTSAAISDFDIASAQHSYIRPIVSSCYSVGAAPDRIELNYLSGVPLVRGRIPAPYAQIIAFLSTAFMPALSCGCDRADQILRFWRKSPSDGEQGSFPITIEQINEIGLPPVRGSFYAYNQIEKIKDTIGVSA